MRYLCTLQSIKQCVHSSRDLLLQGGVTRLLRALACAQLLWFLLGCGIIYATYAFATMDRVEVDTFNAVFSGACMLILAVFMGEHIGPRC